MELKVFTLPSCSICPVAKTIAAEVAARLGVSYREVSLATAEGKSEGLTYDVLSVPSIVFDDEVIARGRLVSKQKLEQEVLERIEKWKARSSS
jgi:glutaredoxin